MIDLYPALRPLLMHMDPEKAHGLTLCALRAGLAPQGDFSHPALAVAAFGKTFQNPLGLAAGFDKDAKALSPLLSMGFGFVEAGTATLRPQEGNPRPRVFRDLQNESVINRMGFPGEGLDAFEKRLEAFRGRAVKPAGLVGANIGINKDTSAPFDDYAACAARLAPLSDYIAVNVSSPNTAGLRDLQAREQLEKLLEVVQPACGRTPLLLKIAPDLTAAQRADIADVALKAGIAGLIVSNTTISRPLKLAAHLKDEKGGLSGRLLCPLALEATREMFALTQGRIPIVGVGGISSPENAYARIRAGASLVQVYTGLAFQGPALIARILTGLSALLKLDGFSHVLQAVGADSGSGLIGKREVV